MVSDKLVNLAAGEVLPLSDKVAPTTLPGWFWPVIGVCAIVLGFGLAMLLMPLLYR